MFGQRKFLPGDIVVPRFKNAPYKIGSVTRIERNGFFDTKIRVVHYDIIHYRSPVSGKTNTFVDTGFVDYSFNSSLKLYQPEHFLIRPIEPGDSIFLATDLKIYFTTEDLVFREKEKIVKSVSIYYHASSKNCNANRYITQDGFDYIDTNLDIPRTNRSLMRKHRPRVSFALPNL